MFMDGYMLSKTGADNEGDGRDIWSSGYEVWPEEVCRKVWQVEQARIGGAGPGRHLSIWGWHGKPVCH